MPKGKKVGMVGLMSLTAEGRVDARCLYSEVEGGGSLESVDIELCYG